MTLLLATLEKEIELLAGSGATNLSKLAACTDSLLLTFRDVESELEAEVRLEQDEKQARKQSSSETQTTNGNNETSGTLLEASRDVSPIRSPRKGLLQTHDPFERLQQETGHWYNASIGSLKRYNGQILKFLKNMINNSKFWVDLDEAYSFPLDLNSAPTREVTEEVAAAGLYNAAQLRKIHNRQYLMKSIAMHFLKSGYENCLEDILNDSGLAGKAQMEFVDEFNELGWILEDIKVRHDLTLALGWLERKQAFLDCPELLFRLHTLQFILILKGDARVMLNTETGVQSDGPFPALLYSKMYISRYYEQYADQIEPLMTLLLFKPHGDDENSNILKEFIYKVFVQGIKEDASRVSQKKFIAEILRCFPDVNSNQGLFETMANRLASEFCADMGLSNDLSLFEALLSGFVNLPTFYKYNRLQLKLGGKKTEETNPDDMDLPFQLPDKNRFLFNYHPIFICPVSKEQLMPLTTEEEAPKRNLLTFRAPSTTEKNPVVVFNLCRHLALKESVRSLLRGTDRFKCHYCYKKHKILEVKDAYFIDL